MGTIFEIYKIGHEFYAVIHSYPNIQSRHILTDKEACTLVQGDKIPIKTSWRNEVYRVEIDWSRTKP